MSTVQRVVTVKRLLVTCRVTKDHIISCQEVGGTSLRDTKMVPKFFYNYQRSIW